MALTKESFLATIKQYTTYKRYIVAYSGGLDSSVLLHLCVQIKDELKALGISLEAIYVDHRLQQDSAAWAEFCQTCCQLYQIPFQSLSINAQPQKRQSPEAAAREARYQALKDCLRADDCLLTAHHRSDQAETLLLQMLRGSGPKGLAAMPVLKSFYQAKQLRPLLDVSQAEIKAYAEQHQLQWIEDKSNSNLRYKRNFLRHKIMPALKEQWPSMEKTLHRVSHLQAESIEILEDIARQDIACCQYQAEKDGPIDYLNERYLLSLSRLQELSSARINNSIQYWLRSLDVSVLNSVLLQRLQDEFIFAHADTQPLLQFQKRFSFRRFSNFLVLCIEQSFDSNATYVWHIEPHKTIAQKLQTNAGTIYLQHAPEHTSLGSAVNPAKLGARIEIRFRQGGERFQLTNQSHHSLKKWFQENRIPPWMRGRVPLFYSDGQLFQVANRIVDIRYKAGKKDQKIYLVWSYR